MSVDMNAYGVLLSYLGGSGFTRLLYRVESKAKRLINCSVLSTSLNPLSLRRGVDAISLFYRYRSDRCSRELFTRYHHLYDTLVTQWVLYLRRSFVLILVTQG